MDAVRLSVTPSLATEYSRRDAVGGVEEENPVSLGTELSVTWRELLSFSVGIRGALDLLPPEYAATTGADLAGGVTALVSTNHEIELVAKGAWDVEPLEEPDHEHTLAAGGSVRLASALLRGANESELGVELVLEGLAVCPVPNGRTRWSASTNLSTLWTFEGKAWQLSAGAAFSADLTADDTVDAHIVGAVQLTSGPGARRSWVVGIEAGGHLLGASGLDVSFRLVVPLTFLVSEYCTLEPSPHRCDRFGGPVDVPSDEPR